MQAFTSYFQCEKMKKLTLLCAVWPLQHSVVQRREALSDPYLKPFGLLLLQKTFCNSSVHLCFIFWTLVCFQVSGSPLLLLAQGSDVVNVFTGVSFPVCAGDLQSLVCFLC